jgi:hypothetical protein
MKRLSHVAFAHPIPIPGTHVRQGDFSALDGWTITDEDGCITLEQGETRFYTYVSASCVEAKPEPSWTCGVCQGQHLGECPRSQAAVFSEEAMSGKAGKRKR